MLPLEGSQSDGESIKSTNYVQNYVDGFFNTNIDSWYLASQNSPVVVVLDPELNTLRSPQQA